ncbi:hypothetical protein BJF79_31030 [Actinomadura sp. CNU-125]|uniref:hypothetical protein n=1 Tax=Actinomadura sp. CNU-125 TaxID=1904961 RepID=UPI0009615459|nr:hypothetical protein [Actinomadura sp. CNU-125]OLT36526.1 hypothetical protein BJF79_31030 [Actinomadura sp. CNU-125]
MLYLLDGVRHGFLDPRGPAGVGAPAPVMDDGRLAAAPLPRAARRDAHGAEERTVFSYTTIGDFFDRVLRDRRTARVARAGPRVHPWLRVRSHLRAESAAEPAV